MPVINSFGVEMNNLNTFHGNVIIISILSQLLPSRWQSSACVILAYTQDPENVRSD